MCLAAPILKPKLLSFNRHNIAVTYIVKFDRIKINDGANLFQPLYPKLI